MTVIAEALATRKDLLNEARDVQARISANAIRYEDDETPVDEDPNVLLARYEQIADEAQALTVQINKVNNLTTFAFDGETMSLMEAIALRERLLADQRAYKAVADAAGTRFNIYSGRTKDDIKQVAVVDAKAMRKKSNDAAIRVRRLDMAMQKVNWATEID